MKFLTLEEIKQQLRIEPDFTMEDKLLTRFGNSAEQTVLRLCNRTLENIVAYFGTKDEPVPSDLIHAALLLVSQSYQYREAVSVQSLYSLPYAFDMKIKPFMRLADEVFSESDIPIGTDAKILFSVELPDGLTMKDVAFDVTVKSRTASVTVPKEECIIVTDESYVVMVGTNELGVGHYKLVVTLQVPDTDYESVIVLRDSEQRKMRGSDGLVLTVGRTEGLRTVVVNIDPKINVIL